MEQVQKQKPGSEEPDDEQEVTAKDERNEKLSQEIDDLLDEIDTVLEPEAEKFVAEYIQKGGQLWPTFSGGSGHRLFTGRSG